ncbi:MAG: CPBP family intramembrane metalloprotease [Flavobacteriales bacterium]|nr:CPBP family intramembrane metalloprotease [Bacteroidota bacterium]MCB9241985.1 CPBP family intramembrane metalloprotease [Flavobacteriales bacterium]
MRKFIGYIRKYLKEEFHPGYFIYLALVLGLSIYFAYHNDLYRTLRDRHTGNGDTFLFYFIQYIIPYTLAFGGYIVFHKRYDLLTNWKFLALTVLAVGIFSLRSSVTQYFLPYLDSMRETYRYPLYWYRVYSDLGRYLAVMIPVTIYWYFDRSSKSPYGFTLKEFNLKPYFGMLFIMLPFVLGFAFTDHFGESYPRAAKWGLGYFDIENPAHGKYFLFYEFIYGVDFVSIEYFFRGFLIIAFARYVGPGAILPMAAFYVFIHFGKPYVETISSFFGGTLLGILSYYSRSIWGGIVVHVGIAWLMELGAFVDKMNP